jgi:hypothetical protein
VGDRSAEVVMEAVSVGETTHTGRWGWGDKKPKTDLEETQSSAEEKGEE